MRRVAEVTEEVARWVFEVHLMGTTDWFIAFTNPTAGPWKRVLAPNAAGITGEVHRFERESTRPDLICVSDNYHAVLIVEAKGRIASLLTGTQLTKSSNLVHELGEILRNKSENEYWQQRATYTIFCGLLWGAEAETLTTVARQTLRAYADALPHEAWLSRSVVGIECLRMPGEEDVGCFGFAHDPEPVHGLSAVDLVHSLGLPLREQ